MARQLNVDSRRTSESDAAKWPGVTRPQKAGAWRGAPTDDPHGDRRPLGRTVILGVAESDAHVVANRLIAMLLKEHGYDVVNLGACTPVHEFMEAYQRHPDAIAIVIGSLNGHAARDLADLPDAKRDYQVRCPILLGGKLHVAANAVGHTDGFAGLGVDHVIQDPNTLLALFEKLTAAAPEQAA